MVCQGVVGGPSPRWTLPKPLAGGCCVGAFSWRERQRQRLWQRQKGRDRERDTRERWRDAEAERPSQMTPLDPCSHPSWRLALSTSLTSCRMKCISFWLGIQHGRGRSHPGRPCGPLGRNLPPVLSPAMSGAEGGLHHRWAGRGQRQLRMSESSSGLPEPAAGSNSKKPTATTGVVPCEWVDPPHLCR